MNRSEYMAIKPGFLSKYARRYDAAMAIPEIQAGIAERILREAKEDIDDQFPHVLRIDGDTAFITLYGPMSEDGPDWIDLYFGYNGVAYKNLIRASEEILKADNVKNVIINGNTPGGNIDGLEAATQSLEFLAQKIPVTAINRGMIASAGVWYTSAAHNIVAANKAAMIGSIGVVIDTLDFTGYYNSFGIETITITNEDSPNKRPDLLTPEGKAVYVKELNGLFGVFVDRVTSRGTIAADAIKALKGEMIIAADAVKIGLMDSIEGITSAGSAEPAGSGEGKEAKIQTEKELTMEADVKEALDKITTNVSAIGTQVAAMAKPAEEKKSLSDEDKKFSLNIANGDTYPDAVKKEAVKALAGMTEMSAFKTTVTVFDAMKEKDAGTDAGKGEDGKETKPTGTIPGGEEKKSTGIIDSEAEAKAELNRINGVEV